MRVLIPLHGFVRWNGGLDLIRLLVAALDSLPECEIELAFALPSEAWPNSLLHSGLRRVRQILAKNTGESLAGGREALLGAAFEMVGNRQVFPASDNAKGIISAAEASQADLIFPTMYALGADGPPRIGYIFDFQHRYLPHLFSKRMRLRRDRVFRQLADDSNYILVNSHAVLKDVVKFLDFPPSKILALPFSPYALPRWFDLNPEDAKRKHGIKGRYLLICNHFWQHKDHATALRAFALIRANAVNSDLQLVMTGDFIDHRNPRHYAQLQQLAVTLGVSDDCHFLGLIPKQDQLALIRGCVALMQPTLFEGGPGGGSVYEAIGLGAEVVVSDIPINREIDQGHIQFFEAGNPQDLADKILIVLSTSHKAEDDAALIEKGATNLHRLGSSVYSFLVGCSRKNWQTPA